MKENPTVVERLEECYVKGIGLKITHDDIVDLLNIIKPDSPIASELQTEFGNKLVDIYASNKGRLTPMRVLDLIKSEYCLVRRNTNAD